MDRRSWPWRRKSSETLIGPVDLTEASPAHSTRHLDEQTMPRESTICFPDDETDPWQQSDEKFDHLKERLSVALLDSSAKELLVKQHAKVAEEAVSGWEKAEVEARSLKEDLDSVVQQRIATQDRVAHLDDALKECMRQLRLVREEQEAKIHDATMRNLRDWEKAYVELEERLVDMEQKYLAAADEAKAMSQLLQERAVMITESDEARSCAESKISALQSQVEATEQDYNTLKLKYSKLLKEFDIRNEEKNQNGRSIDAAGKQHLETTRKITKLEEECQRLRGLLRTKLPGSGASIQMKSQAGGSKLKNDNNRRTVGKIVIPSRIKEEQGEQGVQESPSGGKDTEALMHCVTAMEDETRRLKELLTRRDNELNQSRLMCARTASKLSSVEEQLECLLHNMGTQKNAGNSPLSKHIEAARSFTVSCEPSLASVSEDGNDDCSDAWASALISELAHIKIDKATSFQKADLDGLNIQFAGAIEVGHPVSVSTHETNCQEQELVTKDVEVHADNQMYEHIGDKPQPAEGEVATLQSHNVAIELQLQTVKCQLNAIFQAQDNGNDVYAVLDQLREAIGVPCIQTGRTQKFLVNVDQKVAEPELLSAVSKLVKIAETLGAVVPSSDLFCKNVGAKAKTRQMSAEGHRYLEGPADTVQLLEDLASALGDIVRVDIADKAKLRKKHLDTQEIQRLSDISDNGESICSSEQLVFREKSNKALGIDEKNKPSVVLLEQDVARLEGELRRAQGEKVALETHMRMEFQRFEGLQNEVSQFQGEKVELEHVVEVAKGELDNLRVKLQQTEQVEYSYQEKVSSAEASKKLMEEQFQSLMATKGEAEFQLKTIKAEHILLQDTQAVLARESALKTEKIAKLEIKCQELSNYVSQNSALTCSKCSTANGGEAIQEEEIAEKLAECQETILLLGKQLKTFTSSKEQFDDSSNPSINKQGTYSSPNYCSYPCHVSKLRKDIKHPLEARTGTRAYKQRKMRVHAQKEVDWEPQRDSNTSDTIDLELMNLSKSGRPLLELFGNKTPAHEHYIKAVEQLTSSSDDEFIVPKKVEALNTRKSNLKSPLHRKKSDRSYKGVDMSKSMDNDTGNEKQNTFTRLFSRGKNS